MGVVMKPYKKMTIKEEFLERRKELQIGFQIHLEYDYLLNTDVYWILNEIRTSIREEIKSRRKEKKLTALTLDVDDIKTGDSIDLWVYLGTVVAPEIIDRYGSQIMDIIINAAWERLRNRRISKKTRTHIRNGRIKRMRGHPGGEFEIIEADGEEIIIEE